MVKKGQKATKLDMDKIKEALAEGLGAPAIAAKFQYSTSSVSKAVKRIRGTPKERKVGSGRKATGDKSEEIEAILSQDPNKSVSEIAKAVTQSKSTTHRILRKKLGFKPLKNLAGPKLTENQKAKRLEVCRNWKTLLEEGKLDPSKVFWTDEKLFKAEGTLRGGSAQNNRIWVKKNLKKKDIPAGILLRGGRRGRFTPVYVMVGMGASHRGLTPPYFCPKGLSIDQEAYIKTVSDNYAPFMKALYGDTDFFFQQDGASSHTAKESVKALEKIFGKKKVLQNPPNSPDLSLLDYHTWNMIGVAQMIRRFAVCLLHRKAPRFPAFGVFFMWAGGGVGAVGWGGWGAECGWAGGGGPRKIRRARPRLRQ